MKNLARRHSLEKNIKLEDRLTKRSEERPIEQNHNKTLLSPTKRERSKAIIEEELSMYENHQIMESVWSSRVSQCCGKISRSALMQQLRRCPLITETFNPEAAAFGEL